MKSKILIIVLNLMAIQAYGQDYERVNIGRNVNSQYDEITPIISPDGKTLYFCRGGDPQNVGYNQNPGDQDIWASYLQPNGVWSKAVHLDGAFNSLDYDSPIGTSADGKMVYMRNMYSRNGSVTSGGISRSRFSRNQWSYPENMPITDYYNTSSVVNYHLASDEKTLILNLRTNDTVGQMDLYISYMQSDGSWSAPLNLGDSINTRYNEVTPFIAADMKTLYFSSERPGGSGGYDLYISKRLDDTWQRWSRPRNLGPKINSSAHEISYFVAASGEFAVFSVDTEDMGKDLYTVRLPEEYRPERVALVSGKVVDNSNAPQEAKVIYERIKDGKTMGQTTSDPATGEFTVSIPMGEEYGFRAEKNNFLPVNENLDLRKTNVTNQQLSLTLVPIKKGEKIRFNNIFFTPRSSTLTSKSHPELNRLAEFMKKNNKVKILIEGHTDSVGSTAYNQGLSNQRAKSVYSYLLNQGVSKEQLSFKGFGENNPVASNSNAAGRKKNRRVEFKILEN